MQKLKLQNTWNKEAKSFDKDKFEVRETDGTISGKVSISSKKGDKWISKPIPFVAFKSKIDEETALALLHSAGKPFEAEFNLAVDSFTDKEGKEVSYFKIIINRGEGEGISKHSVDKGSYQQEQEDLLDDQIPF